MGSSRARLRRTRSVRTLPNNGPVALWCTQPLGNKQQVIAIPWGSKVSKIYAIFFKCLYSK